MKRRAKCFKQSCLLSHHHYAALMLAIAIWIGGASTPLWAKSPEKSPARPLHLNKAEQEDLELLLGMVRETKLDLFRRRDVVMSLFRRHWPQAIASLCEYLKPNGLPSTQHAIALAIGAFDGQVSQEFVPYIISLLATTNGTLSQDLSSALGRYQSDQVTHQLVELAINTKTPIRQRRGMIFALGRHRSQFVAGVLVDLLHPLQLDTVREAAASALEDLTGISHMGIHYGRWQIWWRRHQKLSRDQWQMILLDNFSKRTQYLANQNDAIASRLIEVQGRVYRLTPKDQRLAVLLRLAKQPETATRKLALRLMEQRLVEQQTFTPQLLEALRQMLNDLTPVVREKTARLLRDLRDEKGLTAIAQRIGREQDPLVLQAYLQATSEKPASQVVNRAMELLDDSELYADAAGVLARAIDAGLLTTWQRSALQHQLKQLIGDKQPPQPKVIELLGRVGDQKDWARIESWLTSENDAIKTAAAQVWAKSEMPLLTLARQGGDLVIQPILIAAAARRGNDAKTLQVMLQYPPKQMQLSESWQRTMVVMAGRIEPQKVLVICQAMLNGKQKLVLQYQMLTAVIMPLTKKIEQQIQAKLVAKEKQSTLEKSAKQVASTSSRQDLLVKLLLQRAQVALLNHAPKDALADLYMIQTKQLSLTGQRERQLKLLIQAHLSNQEDAQAVKATAELVTLKLPKPAAAPASTPAANGISVSPVEQVAFLYIAKLKALIAEKNTKRAILLMAKIEPLFQGRLSDLLVKQFDELKLALKPKTAIAHPPKSLLTQPAKAIVKPVTSAKPIAKSIAKSITPIKLTAKLARKSTTKPMPKSANQHASPKARNNK